MIYTNSYTYTLLVVKGQIEFASNFLTGVQI